MAPDPVSRLHLERWAMGDLPVSDVLALKARRAEDPELDARMMRVQQEVQQASIDLPPLDLPRTPEPAPSRWGSRLRPWAALAVAATAAVMLVQLVPTEEPATGVVWRGAALDLELVRVRAGEAQPMGALVDARAGDRLQYTVTPSQDGFLAVVDVQDDGEISMWLPSEPVRAGLAISGAVVLDDYAGLERVYVLLGPTPVTVKDVSAALASRPRTQLAELDALPDLDGLQRSLLILKETP